MKLRMIVTLFVLTAVSLAGCSNQSNPTAPELSSAPSVVRPLLAAGTVLDSAHLMLYVRNSSEAQLDLFRVNSMWEESAITWNSFAAGYDAVSAVPFKATDTGWVAVPVTRLVQDWIDKIYPNLGLVLVQDSSLRDVTCFLSRETGATAPMLKLFYTLDSSMQMESLMAVADAPIRQDYPDSNFASEQLLCTGWTDTTASETQSLIRFEIEVDEGCTYSKGYWKNHAGFGPQADVVTDLLPQMLGSGGGKSISVDSARQAVDLLSQKVYGHPSNGITKLYAQLLAAKLNIENGAAAEDIGDVIDDADAFLVDYDWEDWDSLDMDQRHQVSAWKGQLDEYNNGYIGPGHCDDDHNDDGPEDDDQDD